MHNRQNESDFLISQDSGQENDASQSPRSCHPGCGHCTIKPKRLKYIAYSFPIATAIREASETAIELRGQHPAFIATVTAVNFCAELSIDSRFTVEGVEHSYKIIKKRQLPTDWPVLSKTKEIIAITSSTLMGTYAAFCDSVLAYDFIHQLPSRFAFTQSVNMTGWKALSGITAGFVGMGRLTGEGMATYRITRDILAGVKPEYSNTFSRYISPTVGCALGILGSCGDAVMTCTGMYDVFNITEMPAKITFGALSTINGVTDYCMNGTFVIECLDTFFGSFTPEDGRTPGYKDKKAIAALTLSLAAGTLLAYSYQGMAKDTLEELLAALGIDLAAATTPIVQIFACGGASSYLVNAAGSIYPMCYIIADKLGNGLNAIYNKMSTCCQRQDEEVAHDNLDFSDDEGHVAIEFGEDNFDEYSDLSDDPLDTENQQFLQLSDKEQEAVIIDMDLLTSSDDENTDLIAPAHSQSVSSFLFRLFSGKSTNPEQDARQSLKHSF